MYVSFDPIDEQLCTRIPVRDHFILHKTFYIKMSNLYSNKRS